MRHVKNDEYEAGYNCVRFHPDGLILGTGTGDALVRIWDMKQAVRFPPPPPLCDVFSGGAAGSILRLGGGAGCVQQ